MSEVSRPTNAPLIPAKSQPVSAVSGGASVPQGGKALPPKEPSVVAPSADVQALAEKSQASIQAAVAQMNEYIQSTQRDLQFSYDPDSGQTVVKVLDRSTQEVIRQIPDEIFLKLAETLDTNQPIQLFSARV